MLFTRAHIHTALTYIFRAEIIFRYYFHEKICGMCKYVSAYMYVHRKTDVSIVKTGESLYAHLCTVVDVL